MFILLSLIILNFFFFTKFSMNKLLSLLLVYMAILFILIFWKFWNKIFFSFWVYLSVVMFLGTKQLWAAYFYYEISLIPMLYIIMSWGLNPYRFSAFYYMLLYSLFFSAPPLLILLMNLSFLTLFLDIKLFYASYWSLVLMNAMFFVKTPIYMLHFWLPKAHVEASSKGSILLASLLLKMGSLGCLKLFSWGSIFLVKIVNYFVSTAILAAISCCLQTDLKKLIAMTSVAHMSMSLASLFTNTCVGVKIFFIMNILHTSTSGGLFYMSGLLSKFSNTRMIYLQHFLKYNSLFVILMALILMNLGVPPFFSIVSEFMFSSLLIALNFAYVPQVLFLLLVSLLYTLILANNMKYFLLLNMKPYEIFLFAKVSIFPLLSWFISI